MPPLKLVHATRAQQLAAWNKVWPELVALAQQLAGSVHVPFVNVQAMVQEKLDSPEARQMAMKLIDDAIEAALNVPDNSGPTGGA